MSTFQKLPKVIEDEQKSNDSAKNIQKMSNSNIEMLVTMNKSYQNIKNEVFVLLEI